MAAAREGDREALERLLRQHQDHIFGVCRRITGSDADAADASQEAMIAIARGIRRFDERSAFATWAYRIATNASLDELRRRRRRPPLAGHEAWSDSTPLLHDPVAVDPVDAVAERMAIDDALAAIQEDFRVAVVLRDVGDLDYSEIAEVLQVPVGTVKSRIARGRQALVALLEPVDRNQGTPPRRPSGAP